MPEAPRILFFGYSEVGYACLERLLARGANVVGVFTHEDDNKETAWFRSVKRLAGDRGIPAFTPTSLKADEWEQTVRDLKPDLLLSLYYRNLIPERIFKQAKLGAYNMHGSYLPRYRGRAPLNWAIIHGEPYTGVSLHVMEKAADTGDIIDQEKVPIGPRDTAGDLTGPVRDAAVRVLDRQLSALLAGTAKRTPQDVSQATYFGKRTPEDGRIDWALSSQNLFNFVRALTRPFPGAFSVDAKGRKFILWWAEIEALRPEERAIPAGTVLQTAPLRIRTGDGVVRAADYAWDGPCGGFAVGDKLDGL